ncbi:MAG: SCO family protein [Planctomycetota bacterium]|jgi:protein SCO1/2
MVEAGSVETGAGTGRKHTVEKLIYVGVGLILMGALTMAFLSSKARAEKPQVLGQVPAWTLMEMSGRAVSSADLQGSVYVADFIFTSCAGQCHDMSTRMAALQKELPNRADLRFISVTVDPETDTEEKLRSYSTEYGAEAGRWLFLRGDKKTVHELSARGFMLAVREEEAEPADEAFVHSPKFVLVDQQGQIRGFYDSNDPKALIALKKDLRPLLP